MRSPTNITWRTIVMACALFGAPACKKAPTTPTPAAAEPTPADDEATAVEPEDGDEADPCADPCAERPRGRGEPKEFSGGLGFVAA